MRFLPRFETRLAGLLFGGLTLAVMACIAAAGFMLGKDTVPPINVSYSTIPDPLKWLKDRPLTKYFDPNGDNAILFDPNGKMVILSANPAEYAGFDIKDIVAKASKTIDAGIDSPLPKIAKSVRRQAPLASVVIEAPDKATMGSSLEARLIASRAEVAGFLAITPEPAGNIDKLPVAYQVRARAHSKTMEVTPADWITQSVADANMAIWTWKLEPKQAGDSTLTIEMEHYIKVGEEDMFVPVQAFPKKISIEVDWLQRLAGWTDGLSAMEKLIAALATVIAAILSGGVVIWRKWKSPEEPTSG